MTNYSDRYAKMTGAKTANSAMCARIMSSLNRIPVYLSPDRRRRMPIFVVRSSAIAPTPAMVRLARAVSVPQQSPSDVR